MKTLSAFIIALLIISCFSCTAPEKKNPLEGTWEMIKATASTPDSTMNWIKSDSRRQIKIISKTYFATIAQDTKEGNNMFNGGTYTLEEDTYTENLEFFNNSSLIGHSASFKIEISKDQLKMSGILPLKDWGVDEHNLNLDQVYQRID